MSPFYNFQCTACPHHEQIVAGLDDAMATCSKCGELMLRLDEDLFEPYFEEAYYPEV